MRGTAESQSMIGSLFPEKLEYQDPAHIRFYDGAIRKTMDKFAKRMGVEKSKSISFTDDPNGNWGWVIDLPKDRKAIEDLGLYMPSLGKDKADNVTSPVPAVRTSRSLALKRKYNATNQDELLKELTERELELEKYSKPGEPQEVIPVEGSQFAQKEMQLLVM